MELMVLVLAFGLALYVLYLHRELCIVELERDKLLYAINSLADGEAEIVVGDNDVIRIQLKEDA